MSLCVISQKDKSAMYQYVNEYGLFCRGLCKLFLSKEEKSNVIEVWSLGFRENFSKFIFTQYFSIKMRLYMILQILNDLDIKSISPPNQLIKN